MAAEELLGYEELSALTGRSVGALRVARSKGRLPEPDAPGPRWRRETLEAFLTSDARAVAGDRVAAPAPSSGPGPSPATPVSSGARTAAPAASGLPFPGADAEDARRRSLTIDDVLACPHDELKRTTYAAWCLRCGRRLQGDRFTGAGYLSWTPGLLERCPHPPGERVARPWGAACLLCGSPLR
jgi:hypothetical protein